MYLQEKAAERPLLASAKKTVVGLPPVVPVPVKTADSTTHVVQTKETLYSISRKYGVSLEQLKEWNKLDTLDLKTGQQLVIYKN